MQLWPYTLGSVVGVSLVSLVGVVVLASRDRARSANTYLISLAVGGLLEGERCRASASPVKRCGDPPPEAVAC